MKIDGRKITSVAVGFILGLVISFFVIGIFILENLDVLEFPTIQTEEPKKKKIKK